MQDFLTVSQVNQYINSLLQGDDLLSDCWLKGEISGFKLYQQSGHMYFTLKDQESSISCVMFKSRARSLAFQPENGQEVLLRGYLAVFGRQGKYQVYVQEMQPSGIGSLLLILEQMKNRLEKQGYFAPESKKPLPAMANRIGIVTSQDGAALRDIVRVLKQRHHRVNIVLVHSAVQGQEAPSELAAGIALLNRQALVDTIIVGRGGGSLEDLMAFNSEEVVRAIFESKIPVISAVGHEIDFTLADLAADVRAATPTQAAQLAVPDLNALEQSLERLRQRMIRSVDRHMAYLDESLDRLLGKKIWKEPQMLLKDKRKLLSEMTDGLLQVVKTGNNERGNRLLMAARSLDNLSPLKVLERGYSVVARGKKIIRRGSDVNPGDMIVVSIIDADLEVEVRVKEQVERWKA